MIRSMTGYGQAIEESETLRVSVVLRSVNNRFADIRLRLPAELTAFEAGLRRRVSGRIRRGRVEGQVKLERPGVEAGRPTLNRPLLDEVLAACGVLRDEYGLRGTPAVADLLTLPGLFRVDAPPEMELDEAGRELLERAVERALDELERDRLREGTLLAKEMRGRVESMRGHCAEIRERAADMTRAVKQRLVERLAALAADVELDPGRVEQEAAIFADRSDVTEETVRLIGHLQQAAELLDRPDGEPLGKRLEFLLQEIQRETNTTASKSADLELTRCALLLKAEVEKVREQVQNLE